MVTMRAGHPGAHVRRLRSFSLQRTQAVFYARRFGCLQFAECGLAESDR